MFKKFTRIWNKPIRKLNLSLRKIAKKNNFLFGIEKRQKFIISVIILSQLLFWSEQLFGKSGIYVAIVLSFLTDILVLWAISKDLSKNFSLQVFILPFFYSLACALFYFLVPVQITTRIAMTTLYAIGLYSLLLCENIFIVSSIRTIALLSSARTVSFMVTILSYFFLSNVVFSLHMNIFITLILILSFSFPLILYSLWTHTLNKNLFSHISWVFLLTVCLVEIVLVLWFWSTAPTIIAIFLTCVFYILIGLSQMWIDKRLFKSVMWEYIWVAAIVLIVFSTFALRTS